MLRYVLVFSAALAMVAIDQPASGGPALSAQTQTQEPQEALAAVDRAAGALSSFGFEGELSWTSIAMHGTMTSSASVSGAVELPEKARLLINDEGRETEWAIEGRAVFVRRPFAQWQRTLRGALDELPFHPLLLTEEIPASYFEDLQVWSEEETGLRWVGGSLKGRSYFADRRRLPMGIWVDRRAAPLLDHLLEYVGIEWGLDAAASVLSALRVEVRHHPDPADRFPGRHTVVNLRLTEQNQPMDLRPPL